jgi:shikimate dehydrogenase
MTRLHTLSFNGESTGVEDVLTSWVAQQVRAAVAARLGAGPAATPPGYLVGLVGRGIGLSKSPAMHEREGARMGLGYAYVLLDFDQLGLADADLGAVIEAARVAGFAGFNVTHPFKQAVIAHLDDLSPEAAAIGAVNTVLLGARAVGHNTDSWGFAESFRETLDGVRTERILQLGAGGAGAAVAYALLTHQVGQLSIADLDPAKADGLAQRLNERFGPRVVANSADDAIGAADGIVNTTPMGMSKYPGLPFSSGLLTPRHWVADIVYFPADTELLQLARGLGCRTMAGTGMAVYQAVRAFELFTGLAPDRDRMIDHFRAAA